MPSLLALGFLLSTAQAQSTTVPDRQIPPTVLVELQLLENRFELALAADCPAEKCSSNGCAYLDHAVADQPRSASMPGFGEEAGPGSVAAQAYLTRALCSFSHESSVPNADAAAMVRRLQTRLTQGWTVVTVEHEALPPIPSTVVEPAPEPEPEAPVEPTAVEPPPWTFGAAAHELWNTLLPDAWWMVGILLGTLATMTLIWAGRRVGRASLEEQALLAQLNAPGADEAGAPTAVVEEAAPSPAAEDAEYVARQEALWRSRVAAIDADHPDLELTALIRDRLRAGDLPLLAKAVLRFPEGLPAAFPQDGETAIAKLELAELLQTVDADKLPGDTVFFRALERHALAAALATQPDAAIVRSLHEDFGSAGLVELIGTLPARMGALLFAMAPPSEQHEAVRLLPEPAVAALAGQLLRSNRMDPGETAALFEVLRSSQIAHGGPVALPHGEITDRGTTFDAAGALSILLPRLSGVRRTALFDEALARFQGTLPLWHREIFLADMLFSLSPESRADLLLAVEVEPLAAWISQLEAGLAGRVLEGVPESLRLTIQATPPAPTRSQQLSQAALGRRALARGFQRAIARLGLPFERVVRGSVEA